MNEDELQEEIDRLREENTELRESATAWEAKFDVAHSALDDIETIARKAL